MNHCQHTAGMPGWFMPVIIVLIIWEIIWKLIAMWKAAKNNHLAWFVCIALINTIGILPIVYIVMNRKKNIMK
ncbi:MAG: DUF5652 family protein [Bacteroidota bacterium]